MGLQENSKWKSPKRATTISKLHPPTLKLFKITLESSSRFQQKFGLERLNLDESFKGFTKEHMGMLYRECGR